MTSKTGVAVTELLAARPDLCLSRKELITLDMLLRTDTHVITNREIAEKGNIPIKSVRRAITQLRKKGIISPELGDRRVIACPTA